ncbi:MAG: MoaD/ThiS family protein [Saprospiraceae bacterium]
MKLNILAFGIARDIVGGSFWAVDLPDSAPTVGDLKQWILETHPRFGALASLQIAVNADFADDDCPLRETDEIALIPPVSGG